MRSLSRWLWLGLICVVPATGKPLEENNVVLSQNASIIDFAPGPENMRFLATVKFRRARVELIKAAGWEKQQNLNIAPAITWWWYEVDLVPETVLNGTWDVARRITLKCRHYLATSDDSSWIGIIAVDSAGKEKWLKDYALRNGQIIDLTLGQGQPVGREEELQKIIRDYLRSNNLAPVERR